MALNRMVSSIRTTELHAPFVAAQNAQFMAGLKVTTTSIKMLEDPYNDITLSTDVVYRYDAPSKRVFVDITPYHQLTKTYVLARGVEAFQITMEPMRSEEALRTG